MAVLGLGKEGGRTMRPSERSVTSVWMSVGAVPVGPCSASLCAAVISLSLMSVGVIALMAECKSYIRNWEIKCEVEFFPVEKGREKIYPKCPSPPRTRSAGGLRGGRVVMCLRGGPVSRPKTPSSVHSSLLFRWILMNSCDQCG